MKTLKSKTKVKKEKPANTIQIAIRIPEKLKTQYERLLKKEGKGKTQDLCDYIQSRIKESKAA